MNRRRYLFCAALVLQPLLRLYGFPIGGTFADYTIIIVAIVILLKKQKNILRISSFYDEIELLPIMVCVMFNILFTWNNSFEVGNQITYWARNVLYYFILIYGVKNFYSTVHGYRVYKVMVYVCTIFLIIQVVASSMFGVYIPGQFGPFALTDIEQQIKNYNIYSYYNLFRPDSLFSEPAHYATFASSFLILCSFQKINKKNFLIMAFCSFGILLSGSTTGLAILVLIWGMWSFRLLKKRGSVKFLVPIVVIALIAFTILMKSTSFQIMINRTFNSRDAINSRFNWISTLTVLDSPIRLLFGLGNSYSDLMQYLQWIPGWIIIIVEYGIVGLLLYVTSYLLLFVKANKEGKLLVFYFIILGMGTEVVADMYVLVIMPFLIRNDSLSSLDEPIMDMKRYNRMV